MLALTKYRLSTPVLATLLLLLCLPAYLLHLDLIAFTGDEAIRSLVALEMKLSGNYIATTLHGAPYLNKPPLFNWFLLIGTWLWGGFGEWPARLTTLFFLALYGVVVYRCMRQAFSRESAFLGALMVVTSGRFLFYDSMLGLIDTAFSVVVYAQIMSLYWYGRQERWTGFFLSSYLLMALGFLLKGFPAVVFQALTLPMALLFFRELKRFFSLRHLAGVAMAAGLLGAYLLVYSWYRPLEVFLPNLLFESTKRTVVASTWGHFWAHLLKFPFQQLYHFLPWSLLLLFWFDRQVWTKVRAQPFVYFNLLAIAVNLPVYWTSVQVMPRYLLMFVPLFTTVGLYLWEQNRAANTGRYRGFFYVLGGIIVAAALLCIALPAIKAINYLPGIWMISLGLMAAFALLAWQYFRDRERTLWWFVAALLVARIGFDLLVLPARHDESIVTRARRDARELADKYRSHQWWVYGDSELREPASFYFTQRLGYIIPRTKEVSLPNALYIVNPKQYPDFPGRCVDTLQTDYPEVKLLLYE